MRPAEKKLVVLAGLAMVLFLAGCSSERTVSTPGPSGSGAPLATVYAIGTPSGGPVPTLDESQGARVREIALSDATVQALIGREQVREGQMGPWTNSRGEVIGGTVDLLFDNPVRLSCTWLLMEWNESLYAQGYQTTPYQATVSNVTNLTVFVDLRSGKAVGTITPHGARLEGTPVFPPGYETPPPKPQRD